MQGYRFLTLSLVLILSAACSNLPKEHKVITAKAQGLDISSGVCPHHLVFDWRQMEQSDGLLWKMNPPLRNAETRKTMIDYLKEGKIDWVETDHAPHTQERHRRSGRLSL